MISLTVNGRARQVDADPEMPLLWVVRDLLDLKGTRYACGIGACGACMVHVDGAAIPSCSVPVGSVEGRQIVTIEGLSPAGEHPLQAAWIEEQVPQCGFCQSGQIMRAAQLLRDTPQPTDADIDAAMQGNLCRCGTYPRIRAAIRRAAGQVG
jgi:isoquinoline 1-oxidoreductase alpha subunit